MLFAHYIVDTDPFAIHFSDEWFIQGIRWYGLSYLAGFLIAMFLLWLYTKKGRSPLTHDQNSSLMTYLLLGVIIGGRLGYMLFYDFANFTQNPMSVFQIWRGGMASHGGFIGVIIATFAFSKVHKVSFLKVADIIVTVCPPGIFLGRIANFWNGELWGKVSDVPWAMIFPYSAPTLPLDEIPARHPSQLYEAVTEGLLIFIILQFRFWKTKPDAGRIAGEFMLLYAAARIVCEIFREPDAALILGMSRGAFYSVFCVIIGIAFIVCARMNAQKQKLI